MKAAEPLDGLVKLEQIGLKVEIVGYRWKYRSSIGAEPNPWRLQEIEPTWLAARGHIVEPVYALSTLSPQEPDKQ